VWEVIIYLGGVNGFAAKGSAHLLWRDAGIVNVAINMESIGVSSDSAQECSAPRPRWTKNSKHFAAVNNAFQFVQNVSALLLAVEKAGELVDSTEEDIDNILLEIGGKSVAISVDVGPGDTSGPRWIPIGGGGAEVVESLCPGSSIESMTVGIEC
jgi:hypothetical protein